MIVWGRVRILKMIKYNRNLFVCSGNVDRSVAGEIIFREGLEKKGFSVGKFSDLDGFDFYVGSAGIDVAEKDKMNGSMQLTEDMARRANRIFSIDEMITTELMSKYGVRKSKIVQLDIFEGRSLMVYEEAISLYGEFRRKLEKYLPRR